MNQKLRLAKLKFRRFRYLIKWFLQFKTNKIKPYQNMKEMNVDSVSKSLGLVPHADDEWIGNSQILRKTNATAYYFQFLGNNYNQANKTIRRNELENLQKEINFDLIISDNYDDYSDLEKLISTNNFTDVFIPFPVDWHEEHIKVNTIFHSILSKLKKDFNLHFYHISVPLPIDIKGNYLALSENETKYKHNIFSRIYQSQYNTPISRLNYQLRLNAKNKNIFACENFAELTFVEWTDLLEFVTQNYETRMKPLIYNIDDLILIREKSNQIYQEWKMSK